MLPNMHYVRFDGVSAKKGIVGMCTKIFSTLSFSSSIFFFHHLRLFSLSVDDLSIIVGLFA